jgi:hypothetical protein
MCDTLFNWKVNGVEGASKLRKLRTVTQETFDCNQVYDRWFICNNPIKKYFENINIKASTVNKKIKTLT